MSKAAQEIAKKLKDITHRENDTMIGVVKSVDSDNAVCDVDVDGLTYSEVQLKSIMKSGTKGIKLLPKKDSVVIVERIGKSNELFITMYSEIDSILWEVENMKFFVDKDGFAFNDGNNDGIPKVNPVTQQLNKLENKVNQVIAQYNSHAHSANGAPTTSLITGTLTTTNKDDLENKDVKH